jgi:hypothetical protein
MADTLEHRLSYACKDYALTARCSCGGWSWDAARSQGLSPSQAFGAIEADHRRHVEGAQGGPTTPAGG